MAKKPVKVGNILVLTYWSYKDALVQTYTLPYVRIIQKKLPPSAKIYLLTLEQAHQRLGIAEQQALRSALQASGIHWIPFRYSAFGFTMILRWSAIFFRLLGLIWFKGISHIHAWCTPASAMGYGLSKITGKPLILDSYEPHAEASVENGDWSPTGFPFRLLFALEKRLSRHAKVAIANSAGMEQYAREKYGARFPAFYVKPACVNLENFSQEAIKNPQLLEALGLDHKIVCVYAGKLGGIYLEKEIFDCCKAGADHWKERFRVLLLTNADREKVDDLALASGLDPSTVLSLFVPHDQISRYIGLGDFALNPVKPVPSKRYCTSIKDGEYWALGLPVIIPPGISDDSDIIARHQAGAILTDFTPEAYQKAIADIDHILQNHSREEIYQKIRGIAEKYRNFTIAESIYAKIYGQK